MLPRARWKLSCFAVFGERTVPADDSPISPDTRKHNLHLHKMPFLLDTGGLSLGRKLYTNLAIIGSAVH